jgi:hypothetical protein
LKIVHLCSIVNDNLLAAGDAMQPQVPVGC